MQDVIPIKRIWKDGIFLVGNNKYSKTFKFTDINYIVASEDDKEAKDVALAIELFSNGSLNTFAKQTNVNIHNRLVCYNILELKNNYNLLQC